MNRTRREQLPTRSDILHIIKRWDKVPFQALRMELNVSTAKLMKWSKLIFDNNSKEQRWKEIEDNLNQMEMVDSFEPNMASEYDIHDVHSVYGKNFYVIKRKLVNESRQCYMVTLNHSFNYLVRFDIPVLKHTIEFCPISVGCDYQVHPVGQWEFMQLQHDVPVVDIVADDQYVGAFWLAMSNMLEHAAHEA
jgi:hypothetical protein